MRAPVLRDIEVRAELHESMEDIVQLADIAGSGKRLYYLLLELALPGWRRRQQHLHNIGKT